MTETEKFGLFLLLGVLVALGCNILAKLEQKSEWYAVGLFIGIVLACSLALAVLT